MSRTVALCALVLLSTQSCTGLMARIVARRVSNQQLSIERFHGTLVEKHMLAADPDGSLVKDVWYEKLSKVRVEVKSPPALKGQLFVYDGQAVSMWWPSVRFGMRLRGVPAPTEAEWRSFVRNQTSTSLHAYAFTRLGEASIAGQGVDGWRAQPRGEGPYRFPYESWVDQEHAIPLRLEIFEGPGKAWYEMEYDNLDFDVPVASDTFALQFPADATGMDVDFSGPGVSVEEAQRELDFPLVLPAHLDVQKVLTNRTVVPMATVLMGDGVHWISLTEARQGIDAMPSTGKRVRVGAAEGSLDFLGSYTTLSWAQRGVALTLVSNLAYPEVLELAATL